MTATRPRRSHVLGVAVAIPEPWGGALRDWRRRFGDPLADAIPPHVTLLPPIVVQSDELADVEEHLAKAAATVAAFDVELAGTQTFRPVSPVVFVALAAGQDGFSALAQAVRSGPLDVELEFPYHPHVTVAHHLDEDALDKAQLTLHDYAASFPVRSCQLFEHGRDGVWRTRREFALGPR